MLRISPWQYWCMPQGRVSFLGGSSKRTDAEAHEFKHMLRNVNLLYLGCSVLVLIDLSYVSRFWVCVQRPELGTSGRDPVPGSLVPRVRSSAQMCGQTQFEAVCARGARTYSDRRGS